MKAGVVADGEAFGEVTWEATAMVQAEMVVAWIQLQVGDVGRTLTVEAEGPADGSDVKKRGGCCFHYSKSTATALGRKD